MNDESICEDGALLLGYAAGSLDEAQSTRVARHVERCAKCRTAVQGDEELIQLYRAVQKQEAAHPSPELLVELSQGRSDTPELARARLHAEGCSECREVVSVLEKLETDLSGAPEPTGLRKLWRQWLTGMRAAEGGLSWWLSSPLPAYLLVLLLLYPAYLGLVGVDDLSERLESLEAPTLLSPPITLKSGKERGAGEPQLQIERSGEYRVVTFFVPIAPQKYRYWVELTREGEQIFHDDDARSFDGIGSFALLLPEGALASGSYLLRVEEVDRQSGETANVIEFAFALTN
jgi:hypothetical protein